MESTTERAITTVPPFVLPDDRGGSFNTARLRGRRCLALLFLAPNDPDAIAYVRSFAAHQAQLAWLHTEMIVVIPHDARWEPVPALPFPILRDDGVVRGRVLPDVDSDVAALLVTNLYGAVAQWRTARRVASLPDVETVLAWAWEVAQPKGSCGGVTWTAAYPLPAPSPPAPIGRFTVGATRRVGYPPGPYGEELAWWRGLQPASLEKTGTQAEAHPTNAHVHCSLLTAH